MESSNPPGTVLESEEEIKRTQELLKNSVSHGSGSHSHEFVEQLYRPSIRPPVALLTIYDDGRSKGENIRIRNEQFVVGRTEGDLKLAFDEMLSSKHFAVTRQMVAGIWRWVVTDLQSRNGVFFRVSKDDSRLSLRESSDMDDSDSRLSLRESSVCIAGFYATFAERKATIEKCKKGVNRLLEPARAYIWLRGLALQRMMKTVRTHKDVIGRAVGREIVLPDNSSADLARFLIASGATPSRVAQDREMSVLLQQAIGRLKEDDREVILLRHFEGLSNSEIAEVLGVRHSTATMRYGRALVRLREQLASVLDNRGNNR
jgi:RNA polymerase sigma factor (sigma-70 family)